jgi:hypothetical protein
MDLSQIAKQIKDASENIFLIYAFNSTGKTRLSVEYKEAARNTEGRQTGVYYNAFSEDLFIWDNEHIKLDIVSSSLNQYHSQLNELDVMEKLKPYNPKYDFLFNSHDNPEQGFVSISFFMKGDDSRQPIKISRGEERIFIWCFFLALIEVDSWTGEQNDYFFIDDPVSSMDDHNIFITAFTLMNLIENHYERKKIIITTHHIGLATILSDWLSKGEKAGKFKATRRGENNKYKISILEKIGDQYELSNPRNSVLLYHLRVLQILDTTIKEDSLEVYHLALLRQVLENIASFLGKGQFQYVLQQIGFTEETDRMANIINALTHQKVYYPQAGVMVPDNKQILIEVFDALMRKYHFVLQS